MTAKTYKDPLSLDGRLRVVAGVTTAKVKAVKDLFEARAAGSLIAEATLQEALASSDAIFNMAHLASLNFVPNFDEAERTWKSIAGVRPVNDFKPVTLYSLSRSWNDTGVLDGHGAAPVVPEGDVYPYAYISGEVAEGASVVKRGFKTDFTLEARINDSLGVLDTLPDEMKTVALDTEEADVYGALLTQITAASDLDGGSVPVGNGTEIVLPNSILNRNALLRAIIEVSEREINSRKIQVRGNGFNLLVAAGRGIYANTVLNSILHTAETGGDAGPRYIYNVMGGYNPLQNIAVVETDWLSGDAWMLIPKPGATRRPVIDRLTLRRYETPQLFVENASGTHIGSSSIAPFEGSFDTDSVTLKLRQFGGGVVWDNGLAIVRSDGTNA